MVSHNSDSSSPRKRARIAFLLVDGVGDVSVERLRQRTPLQVAHTPALDAVAGELQSLLCLTGHGFPAAAAASLYFPA